MVRFEGTDERKGRGMRSVRFRIVALFALVAVAFAICTAAWHMSEQENMLRLVETSRRERQRVYSSVLDTRLKQLDTTVLDYTLWDDFAQYTQTRDENFVVNQVDLSTDTMQTAALWVFDEKGNLIHAHGVSDGTDEYGRTLSPEFVVEHFSTRTQVKRYFIKHLSHYDEIVGTSIHRSKDIERTGKIYGYFVVSRPWRNSDLRELGRLANAEVRFSEGNLESDGSLEGGEQGLIPSTEALQLKDENGSPVVNILFNAENKLAWEMRANLYRATNIILIFAGTIIGMAFLCIVLWVGRPLKAIVRGLESDDPTDLRKMLEKDDEFARIALLIQAFFDQRDAIALHNSELEERVAQRTEALENAYDLTIEGWAKALELRDHETEGHSRRVTEMSVLIGRRMGLTDEELVDLRRGALIHDIGKVGIPDSILFKDGPLTAEERRIMERHPVMAYEMFKDIPFLERSLPVALHHHERWDGRGYPYGLKGEKIPLFARIFALADVWDALRSDRPYRAAWTEETVRAHIGSLSGSHFDPQVVDIYLSLSEEEIAAIRGERHKFRKDKAA